MRRIRCTQGVLLTLLAFVSACGTPFPEDPFHQSSRTDVELPPPPPLRLAQIPAVIDYDSSLSSEHVETLGRAIDSWNDAATMNLLVLGSRREKKHGSTPSSPPQETDDTFNIVSILPCWERGSVIGTTNWQEFDSQITNFEIVLNGEVYRFTDALQPEDPERDDHRSVVDMESLLLHELGHALGLMHTMPTCGRSVMHPTLHQFERNPQEIDRLTLSYHYGQREKAPSCYPTARTVVSDPYIFPVPEQVNRSPKCLTK